MHYSKHFVYMLNSFNNPMMSSLLLVTKFEIVSIQCTYNTWHRLWKFFCNLCTPHYVLNLKQMPKECSVFFWREKKNTTDHTQTHVHQCFLIFTELLVLRKCSHFLVSQPMLMQCFQVERINIFTHPLFFSASTLSSVKLLKHWHILIVCYHTMLFW